MKKGSDALKVIHGNLYVLFASYAFLYAYSALSLTTSSTPDRVDATMQAIHDQREIANEISEAISNPLNSGIDLDEVRFAADV